MAIHKENIRIAIIFCGFRKNICVNFKDFAFSKTFTILWIASAKSRLAKTVGGAWFALILWNLV